MKKIILSIIFIASVMACVERNPDGSFKTTNSLGNMYNTITVDSCEYINSNARLAHKGNCKYCNERRKKELKELVEEIKK